MAIRRLFFDIETKRDDSISQELWDELVSPRKNLKDEAKIAASIEEKRFEMMENAALDSDLATVAAISFSMSLHDESHAFVVGVNGSESDALDGFWSALNLAEGNCVGYNILNFDLPFLLKRSFALGVKVSYKPSMIRFRSEPTTDLFQILNSWQYGGGKKLKWMCGRYGIKVLLPGVYGKDVKDMDEATLEKYAISDVQAVKDLYERCNGVYFQHSN